MKKVILDLGCGRNKTRDAIGVDNVALPTVDVVSDLRLLPLPFATNTVNEIVLSHVIEHLTLDEINALFDETFRILCADGVMTISVPHALCVAFASDPTHKMRFTFETLYYFTEQHVFSYYEQINARWQMSRLWASVNLVNNKLAQPKPWQQCLEGYATRGMRFAVRRSRSMTLPDLLVKQLPFWLVSIHCQLQKSPHGLIDDA